MHRLIITHRNPSKMLLWSSYHLKQHCGSDGHPVQLDLKGGIEGEVSVIITAAPLSPVTAVVDVHIQSDCLLLRDGSGWRKEGRKTRGKGSKRRGDRWHDGQAGRQRSGERGRR